MIHYLREIVSAFASDPCSVLGFVFLGSFSVLFIHVQFKMREIGYKTYPPFARPWDWGLPGKYLDERKKYGWSPWPVYLMWPSLALGVVLLAIGTLRGTN